MSKVAPRDSVESAWLDSLLIVADVVDGFCFANSPCACQRGSPTPANYLTLHPPTSVGNDTIKVDVALAETYISGISPHDLATGHLTWFVGYHPTVVFLARRDSGWTVIPTPAASQLDLIGDGYCE